MKLIFRQYIKLTNHAIIFSVTDSTRNKDVLQFGSQAWLNFKVDIDAVMSCLP